MWPVQRGQFDLEENISCIVAAMRALAPELQRHSPLSGRRSHHGGDRPSLAQLIGIAHQQPALVAAPVDPAANPTRVSRLIGSRTLSWYEHNVITEVMSPDAGKGRLVYPGSMQLLGRRRYWARHLREGGELLGKVLTDDGADPVRFPFLDLYPAVMDLPAEVFLDIMRHVYQDRTLVSWKFRIGNQTAGLRSIKTTALMTVEGQYDDIAAPGQTQRAHDLCPWCLPTRAGQLVVPDCGHFSLPWRDLAHACPAGGARVHRAIWPRGKWRDELAAPPPSRRRTPITVTAARSARRKPIIPASLTSSKAEVASSRPGAGLTAAAGSPGAGRRRPSASRR